MYLSFSIQRVKNLSFLLFKAPPRIQLAPGPTYARTGQNVTLPKCQVTGFPAPIVTWWKTPGSLAKDRTVQDQGVLTVVLAAEDDIGSYVCHAKNHLGETSAATSLFVLSPSKFIIKPPQSVIKMVGDDLSINCSAAGHPPPIVSWKRSEGAWEKKRMNIDRGILMISTLSYTDSGVFVCEAKTSYYTVEARMDLIITNRKLQLV